MTNMLRGGGGGEQLEESPQVGHAKRPGHAEELPD